MKSSFIVMALCPLLIGTSFVSAEELNAATNSLDVGHLTLSSIEQHWQEKNHQLQLARDQVKIISSEKLFAAQQPNPQLSINTQMIGTSANHRFPDGADTIVRVDQTFERGSKRELRMQSANLHINAANQDLLEVVRQRHIALAQNYFDVLLTQEKVRITEENLQLFQKTVEVSKLRLKAGDIPSSELSRIEVDMLRAENDVRQAKNDLQLAQAALAYQIGESNPLAIYASDSWPNIDWPLQDKLADINERPDVKAALLRLKTAGCTSNL